MVADELAAAAGENRRTPNKARPILLAIAGGESPHAEVVWEHAGKDCGTPFPSRIGRNGRSKRISMPIESGEGKVLRNGFEKSKFYALGFSRNRRKGHAVENLAGGLKTETAR